MIRLNLTIEEILTEIPNTPDSSGIDLSFTDIYDNIKTARFEEDDQLSLGIWERDLKKADWQLVEKLSFDALKNQTKDLQIIGWLMESLLMLDSFAGILKGIQILNLFLEYFWQSCFPKNENGSSDEEYKIRILYWIADIINKKTIFLFLTADKYEKINLCSYDYALDIIAKSKRSSSGINVLENAKKNNIKTLEDIQIAIQNNHPDFSKAILHNIEEIKIAKKELTNTLQKILPQDANIIFKSLIFTLDKITNIITANYKEEIVDNNIIIEDNKINNPEEPEIQVQPSINTTNTQNKLRDDLYDSLQIIANNLKIIDSHGPSSYILNLVLSWKDKNLLEIVEDMQSGKSEAHKLLKTLQNQ